MQNFYGMLNCIIIDDDELSSRIIEEYVKKTEFLNLVKAFPSAIHGYLFGG